MKGRALAFLLLVFAYVDFVHGDPVYVSRSTHGSVVYSSRPVSKHKEAVPHSLPEIMKGGSRAVSLTARRHTCSDHGGFDCQIGPDKDGSVVCSDGYRDSTAVFRYTCPHPLLEVLEVVQRDSAPTALLIVRNTRGVTAIRPTVKVRSKSTGPILLKGPEELEVGGLAVYELVIPKGVLPGGSKRVHKNNLWITCGNCG